MDNIDYSNEDIRNGLEFMKRIIMLRRQLNDDSNKKQQNALDQQKPNLSKYSIIKDNEEIEYRTR